MVLTIADINVEVTNTRPSGGCKLLLLLSHFPTWVHFPPTQEAKLMAFLHQCPKKFATTMLYGTAKSITCFNPRESKGWCCMFTALQYKHNQSWMVRVICVLCVWLKFCHVVFICYIISNFIETHYSASLFNFNLQSHIYIWSSILNILLHSSN